MEFPGIVRSRLQKTGTTIFTVMSALANEHNAINLSQGFPDFSVSADLINLVHKYMKEDANQYAPMAGIKSLRDKIAQKISDYYSAYYDPDHEITITAGGTQAIYTTITALIREGDEVILFEPAYDCYIPAIELNGGVPVPIQLKGKDFHIDWNEVKKMINPRTRMIIINTPHNPTGSILTARDMLQLETLTRYTDIVILSDEVYEHVIFDDYEHQSVIRFPLLAERSMVVFSFGKTFHATGWKIGYCVGPQKLMEEFRRVHQFVVFAVNTPVQHALAEYMSEKKHYLDINRFYEAKRDYFLEQLKGSAFKSLPCLGSYFQLLDYSNITDEKDTAFAKRMTKDYGVASIPVSVFYNSPVDNLVLRFCFAKEKETLKEAAKRLCAIKKIK